MTSVGKNLAGSKLVAVWCIPIFFNSAIFCFIIFSYSRSFLILPLTLNICVPSATIGYLLGEDPMVLDVSTILVRSVMISSILKGLIEINFIFWGFGSLS